MFLLGLVSDLGVYLIVLATSVFYTAPIVFWIDSFMPVGGGAAFAVRAIAFVVLALVIYYCFMPVMRKLLPQREKKSLAGWRLWVRKTFNFLYLFILVSFLLITLFKEWSVA
ncbi:MAG: hypothetical protein V4749_18415 [Pseudomonadota bacterium]